MTAETKLQKEQQVPMFEYQDAVQQLVRIAKEEKDRLDHQVVLAKSNLSQLKQEHIRLQGEFSQWKMGEEQKFRNELSKKNNQLIDQENRMNLLHKDLMQREIDFKVKEERMMKVEEDRIKIGNDRVEVEKMRVLANTLIADADQKISTADSLMANANSRMAMALELESKFNQKNQELTIREDKINYELKNLDLEKNHLKELKEFVEPKIKEIKEMEDNIKEARKQIEITHQDVINKSEENKIGLKALEDKKAKLDKKELDLNSREDELKRKIILADAKK